MSYNESLNSNSNYPPMSQSEYDRAPWSEKEYPPKDVEVTVSITLSKTMKVPVTDYIIDDEGVDFSSCNLIKAVEDSGHLLNFKDWHVDDFEVILD